MAVVDNFELASVELPKPGAGQVQVRNLWMTVDPCMRGRMNEGKAMPRRLGAAMQGGAIGEVTVSNDPLLRKTFARRCCFLESAKSTGG
jgi:NADPH-dependent curcumin reductase CurA